MRIDPPQDQPAPTGDRDGHRSVEESARASSAIQKAAERDQGSGEGGRRSFADMVERADPDSANDSSVALEDPDRDAWTRQVIGARIHWQYGPDAKRKPIFHHSTSRLDEVGDSSASDADQPHAGPSKGEA